MLRWAEFAATAPEVAMPAKELLEGFRFVLAGTIRRDGTPRISPVEAHVVRDELMLVFAVRVDDVAHMTWEAGALEMLHWRLARGTRRTRRSPPALS